MRKDKLKRIKRISSTERIIRKRIRIIKENWWSDFHGYFKEHPWVRRPGRLKKYNLSVAVKCAPSRTQIQFRFGTKN